MSADGLTMTALDDFSAACEALPFRQLPKPFHRGEKSALRLRDLGRLAQLSGESGTKLLGLFFRQLLAQRVLDRFEFLQAKRKRRIFLKCQFDFEFVSEI